MIYHDVEYIGCSYNDREDKYDCRIRYIKQTFEKNNKISEAISPIKFFRIWDTEIISSRNGVTRYNGLHHKCNIEDNKLECIPQK